MTTLTRTQPAQHPSRRTRIAIIVLTVVGLMHHIDHILRADHSGWPFRSDFNEFTISVLIAYPVAAFVFFTRGRHWLKFGLMVVVYIATQAAHVFVETPVDQYSTWALNASQDIDTLGQPNLLNIASPFLGWVAVVVSIGLSVALLTVIYNLFLDARLARLGRLR